MGRREGNEVTQSTFTHVGLQLLMPKSPKVSVVTAEKSRDELVDSLNEDPALELTT